MTRPKRKPRPTDRERLTWLLRMQTRKLLILELLHLTEGWSSLDTRRQIDAAMRAEKGKR